MSRYRLRESIVNDLPRYKKFFDKRGVSFIEIYRTPSLRHPSDEDLESLETEAHIWKTGDKFYKLAHEYYGDADLWWVIAWFNKKPTEANVEIGDFLHIPFPLEDVLFYYKGRSS